MANTWRSLNKATVAPFALTDVDAALFATDDPGSLPADLAAGIDLRSWTPKGRAVPTAEALAARAAGGPRAVFGRAEADT